MARVKRGVEAHRRHKKSPQAGKRLLRSTQSSLSRRGSGSYQSGSIRLS